MLGSSRGGFDLTRIVDAIETRSIDQVYIIGGDGTIMGCEKIFREVQRRKMKTCIVSVPKTIDNDIPIIDRSFGMVSLFLDTLPERTYELMPSQTKWLTSRLPCTHFAV